MALTDSVKRFLKIALANDSMGDEVATALDSASNGSGLTYGAAGAMAAAGVANANAAGSGTTPARIDHVHAANFGAGGDMAAAGVAAANAAGTAVKPARADHVHAMPYAAVKTAIGAADSALGLNSQKISGLADGAAADDAATKGQLDAVVAGGVNDIQKNTVTIGFADFAGAGEADFLNINVGAALPANARLIGFNIESVTPFDDGGASVDVKVRLGVAPATSSIMDDFDVDTVAAGVAGIGAVGVRGHGGADVGGAQVVATVTTTNPAHLVGLDAGSMVVNLYYVVIA